MKRIDLRSDTVTRPDDAMRRAMASAEVGDDVYGEDPTVAELEVRAAEAMGMEAAVFVPSGTMGNQIAMQLHTRRGDEILCDSLSHIVNYEMGALAALSGVQPRLLESKNGLLQPTVVRDAVVSDVPYQSRTTALVVENTHNLGGGSVYPLAQLAELVELAEECSLKIHLDGARIFNAAVALDCPVAVLTRGFDSVSFCLSKGLGAPVGSLLCGSAEMMVEARRVRKMLGGGMRQVGILAAAGLLALRDGPSRLAEDHRNAAFLAEELGAMEGVVVDEVEIRTNIVLCRLQAADAGRFAGALAERGVLAIPLLGGRFRFVTHRDVSRSDVQTAVDVVREVLREVSAG